MDSSNLMKVISMQLASGKGKNVWKCGIEVGASTIIRPMSDHFFPSSDHSFPSDQNFNSSNSSLVSLSYLSMYASIKVTSREWLTYMLISGKKSKQLKIGGWLIQMQKAHLLCGGHFWWSLAPRWMADQRKLIKICRSKESDLQIVTACCQPCRFTQGPIITYFRCCSSGIWTTYFPPKYKIS